MNVVEVKVKFASGDVKVMYFPSKYKTRKGKRTAMDAALKAARQLYPVWESMEGKWMPDFQFTTSDGNEYRIRATTTMAQAELWQWVREAKYGGVIGEDGVLVVGNDDAAKWVAWLREYGRECEYVSDWK